MANEVVGGDKAKLAGNAYSSIGSAHMCLEAYEDALEWHTKDLMLGQKSKSKQAESRALGNLGRVCAHKGDFPKALEYWMQKVPMSDSALESAWLYHEIGRCHLELKANAQAKEMGEKSKTCAQEANDQKWQLNALVLTAQAQTRLGDLQEAVQAYDEALDCARSLEDDDSLAAIQKAIEGVREQMVLSNEGDEEATQ